MKLKRITGAAGGRPKETYPFDCQLRKYARNFICKKEPFTDRDAAFAKLRQLA
jgi:hypothetical protein